MNAYDTWEQKEEARQISIQITVVSADGNPVTIRNGNGSGFDRITAGFPGTKLQYIASAVKGWHAVLVGSQVGWIAGKNTEVTA